MIDLSKVSEVAKKGKDFLEKENLRNEILKLKKENPQADTSVLEREIDAMVYELYGLSEEEIAIVEAS